MGKGATDISIIIVNYRVKEYVALLLDSIQKSKKNLSIEIFIVDNNSNDGFYEYLNSEQGDIHFIRNSENAGFAKANNQGIERACGSYTLLINPDTIIQEDSLTAMKQYMDETRDCGVLGFKMINPDGSFAKESKRSVPDLKTGMFRVLGLDVLFPKNRVFGSRYLGWLDKDEVAEVPVVSGAGMFWRTSVLKSLKGFDEDFFMYGEDDDLCYRVQSTDYKINYFPLAKLLHFKGESERETSLKSLKKMNKGLKQFFNKHYKGRYNTISRGLISISFNLRTIIQYLFQKVTRKDKAKEAEIDSAVILCGTEKDFPDFLKDDISSSLKTTPICLGIKNIADRKEVLNNYDQIIFDTSSVSYTEAFITMERLRGSGTNFYFLLAKRKIVIGKSRVIKF
ncbi:MAG: glycosyltransferase family 2 protein [Balneola sp.]